MDFGSGLAALLQRPEERPPIPGASATSTVGTAPTP